MCRILNLIDFAVEQDAGYLMQVAQMQAEFCRCCVVQMRDLPLLVHNAHKHPHATVQLLHKSRWSADSTCWYSIIESGARLRDIVLPRKHLKTCELEVVWGRECAPRRSSRSAC